MSEPYVFAPAARAIVAVADSAARYPVRRIWCVGQNYADHVREMGGDPTREPPFFFSKPADAVVPNGGTVPYPRGTADFHHEVELVVALGERAEIYGYAVGIDLTRRDVQKKLRTAGRPWDVAKGFDHSAPITAIHPAAPGAAPPSRGRIWLSVNGTLRQEGDLSQLIWKVPEIIDMLAREVKLEAGDLIFTGTPAGVGPLAIGDRVEAGIEGFETLVTLIGPSP